jgi:hypothetical protein
MRDGRTREAQGAASGGAVLADRGLRISVEERSVLVLGCHRGCARGFGLRGCEGALGRRRSFRRRETQSRVGRTMTDPSQMRFTEPIPNYFRKYDIIFIEYIKIISGTP